MKNNYGVWEREGYKVVEVDFDGDLHCFEVIQNDEVVSTIYPDTIEQMEEDKKALDNGEGVEDWEDGRGNPINLK
jgi:hypothetical protein